MRKMNKKHWQNIITLLMLICGVNCAYASTSDTNALIVEDMEVYRGTTIEVPVVLNNDNDITAFQCNLYLSEGLSVSKTNNVYDIYLTDRKGVDHQISASLQQDGSIKLLCYSLQTLAFSGNNGALFNIRINVAENAADNQSIGINNIILTTTSVKFEPEEVKATINVTDVVALTNKILGVS